MKEPNNTSLIGIEQLSEAQDKRLETTSKPKLRKPRAKEITSMM
jgi:hypothetical protein